MQTKEFIEMLKKRHSYYDLVPGEKPDAKALEELLGEIAEATPDSFNMQAGKMVLLLNEDSTAFWDKVNHTFEEKLSPAKLAGFKNAVGTVLFFTDNGIVNRIAEKFPLYAENFPIFASHAMGMLQINTWTALRLAGYGASLQHYNPVIDPWVHADYEIPEDWALIAQMPFGHIGSEAPNKPKVPRSERVKVWHK